MNESEQIITHYLLGELSEAERVALEERYFTDLQVFDKIVKAENELVDDYARGRLSPQLRERFEQYYLAHPKRRERMKFAQAFVTRLDQSEAIHFVADAQAKLAPGWWRRLELLGDSRALAFATALALLLALGAGWLFFQSKRLREELAQTQTARATQEERERELQQQLANERTRVKDLNDELLDVRSQAKNPEVPATATSPAVATLLLTAVGSRGADTGSAPRLIIRADTKAGPYPTQLKRGRLSELPRRPASNRWRCDFQAAGAKAKNLEVWRQLRPHASGAQVCHRRLPADVERR
jgi:anti-sigma factor RsiW